MNFDPLNETPRGKHPQFPILKMHIDRAVQDLFLDALRMQPIELRYIFTEESQIDSFCQRMIKYWEESENYEICSEIQELCKKFKQSWEEDQCDPDERSAKLMEIFKLHL